MTPPNLVPEGVAHTVTLRCTPRDLRQLADMADGLPTAHQSPHPFHTVTLNGVRVEFVLDCYRAQEEKVQGDVT